MYQKYRVSSLIILCFFVSCISLPEDAKVSTTNCQGSLYSIRRDIKEIQEDNRNLILSLTAGSISSVLVLGPVGLMPIFSIPYFYNKKKQKAEQVIQTWEENYCKE